MINHRKAQSRDSLTNTHKHPVLNETNDEIFLLPFHRLNSKEENVYTYLLLNKHIHTIETKKYLELIERTRFGGSLTKSHNLLERTTEALKARRKLVANGNN